MTAQATCPRCKTPIPAGSPAGQCVCCALSLLLEPEPEENASQSTRTFGPYELLEKLGEGGMGVVWKARQRLANRVVALKVIKGGWFASGTEQARFRIEIETAASLDHPGIVPIYEVGEHGGQLYYSMKLMEGGSLAQRLPNGGGRIERSSDSACDIGHWSRLISQIARATHHAHQHGIIHRDLKPSNILLEPSGQPHISDFGLAKRTATDADLTRSGAMLGSPHYMSPEQAAGKARHVSTATDVFSLGIILYQVLTGKLPFAGETEFETIRLIIESEPQRVRSLNPRIDRDLETICLKSLAKDPARRYASAEALADDLDRWLRHEPISARPPTRWERAINAVRRHPVRAGLAGIVLLAALLAGVFFYGSRMTYHWLMDNIADEHLIVPPRPDGTFVLHFQIFRDARCTFNFWKDPFRYKEGRYSRLEFTNMPPEIANTLQVQVWSDIPGYPDIPRTTVLTNGQIFWLNKGGRRERAFYFNAVNFRSSDFRGQAPDAAIRIVLLGSPGNADACVPTGKLAHHERP